MNKRNDNIFPTPRKMKLGEKNYKIGEICKASFTFCIDKRGDISESAEKYFLEFLEKRAAIRPPLDGKFSIAVKIDEVARGFSKYGPEAYSIKVNSRGATATCSTEAGAYYAALTLASLISVEGKDVYIRECEILDYPRLKTRGFYYENRYNDFLSKDEWMDAIDYAANMKMNTVCIGVYTCWSVQYDKEHSEFLYLPIEKLPEFKKEKQRKYYSVKDEAWHIHDPELPPIVKEDFFGELVRHGKKKNVEVFPLFNSLGHNTLLPKIYPHISAKNEDGSPRSFGMCTRDPQTLSLMCGIYDEIIDKYLLPNGVKSIHLGLDEVQPTSRFAKDGSVERVDPVCKCPMCRTAEFPELFVEYVIKLLQHLKGRGMKNVYIHYDMFFKNDLLTDDFAERLRELGLYDMTVINWWGYGTGPDFFCGRGDKINYNFRSLVMPESGYENWAWYSDHSLNIAEDCALAEKMGADGMISYTTYEPIYTMIHRYLAEACWCGVGEDSHEHLKNYQKKYIEELHPDFKKEAVAALSEVLKYIHPYNYGTDVVFSSDYSPYKYSYLNSKRAYPREHYSEIFEKLDNEASKQFWFDVFDRAFDSALAFLESDKATPSIENEYLKHNIRINKSYMHEALTLYKLRRRATVGMIDKDELSSELSRLINRRRDMILMLENTRIKALTHQPLRLMSICLEYLYELRDRVNKKGPSAITGDEQVERGSAVFSFLR